MTTKNALCIERGARPAFNGMYTMTRHAHNRMCQRGLSIEKIQRVLLYGEPVYDRSSLCFRVGRRVIAQCGKRGIDIRDLGGLHVITTDDGVIMTVYRNRDFRRTRKTHRRSPYFA